jgi:hypothetical protein
LGLLQVWAHRNDVTPDAISYIEIAEATARNGLHALVNGYWSPFYPFLLSIVFRIFHPAIHWEFTYVHGLNVVLFLTSLLCFEAFLKELIAARGRTDAPAGELQPLPEKTLWVLGYVLFLWASQVWLTPAMTTPDMIVAALVYLATAMLLRMQADEGNALLFLALGAVLGVGYLAKTAMLLVGFVFLGSAFLLQLKTKASVSRALVQATLASIVFLAISAPLIVALSKEKHRPTFGDSGKIAYAEYVNRATWLTHWQGEPPGTGIPAHPTRKIFSDPAIYEFARPILASYPPWYDPSYWYEGITPHFSLKGQLRVLYSSAGRYLKMFSRTGALWALLIALFFWKGKAGKWEWGARELWLVWLPSLAALAMYALVLVEQRYVSAFVLILLMWILSSARVPESRENARAKFALAVSILAPALAVAWFAARDLKDAIVNKPYEPWEVAVVLRQIGITPCSQVGSIGSGLDAYWAHLAGVRIVAEIPAKDQSEFIAADAEKKSEIFDKFVQVGAEAIITKDAAVADSMQGWQKIGATRYYIWQPPQTQRVPEKSP